SRFIFVLEVNKSHIEDGVMKSEDRHIIYQKLNFGCLAFDYISPPLGEGMEYVDYFLLLMYKDGINYVYADQLKCFITEFGFSVFGDVKFMEDEGYKRAIKNLDTDIVVLETELPWDLTKMIKNSNRSKSINM